MIHHKKTWYWNLLTISVTIFMLVQMTACSSLLRGIGLGSTPDYPTAEVVFQVSLPEPLDEQNQLVLEVLDDITGMYFNASRYEMVQKQGSVYFTHVPLIISSEIKYRYVKVGENTGYEFNSQNSQVRFRILKVTGPELVQDIVSAWIDRKYEGPLGRIQGQVFDKRTNAPIPNLLVCAGGLQTVTSSDGSYYLEGLVPGVHNMIFYSMDGAYETFQQGALVSDQATTPAFVSLAKRDEVELTFNVKVPQGYDSSMPLRFVSNLQTLGNAYADLSSGSSGNAANYPSLTKISPTDYQLTLKLPKGLFLQYKFTFGDGFWNSELDADGNFVIRSLIVEKPATIRNDVRTFKADGFETVEFSTTAPPQTPSIESVYIQFNPFGWMEPIPMVTDDNRQWHFSLYSPLHVLKEVQYRFCRNGICEIAGQQSSDIYRFSGNEQVQKIDSAISEWKNFPTEAGEFSLITEGGAKQPRIEFLTGVELGQSFPSNWRALIDQGLDSATGYGGDYVVLSPTWTTTSINPPLLEAVPGRDLLWNDFLTQSAHVMLNKQKVIIFPQVNYAKTSEIFWMSSTKDHKWWTSWFEQYRRFILNYADLANLLKVHSIIIGEPSLSPSMTGGLLPDGTPSNVPANSDEQWRQLVKDIRSRFSGSIMGIATVSSDSDRVPGWLDSVDMVYVEFSPKVKKAKSGTVLELKQELNKAINERVLPLYEFYKKPIVIGISYPSNSYAIGGFEPSDADQVVAPSEVVDVKPDLAMQARFYNAALLSVSSKDWITGFISRGFYPYVNTQDASSSVYGKPAGDVLWFWYHFLLNKAP